MTTSNVNMVCRYSLYSISSTNHCFTLVAGTITRPITNLVRVYALFHDEISYINDQAISSPRTRTEINFRVLDDYSGRACENRGLCGGRKPFSAWLRFGS
ncbi:hypothetical protein BKA67DRAFT_62576 [Truncatella angustata]|uniref:Uncharacterized protein n=1 Tax=Truncatella angustata TaxID=152316 RepID=A0A9P9A5B3_9PEZI|nr:uncharacterized protein BKA67DRAFT_62576 [Truncatella angustata]KAH6660694.1 hypothetical protein BKA67DRAFT_62576 [Truncatella angustata]